LQTPVNSSHLHQTTRLHTSVQLGISILAAVEETESQSGTSLSNGPHAADEKNQERQTIHLPR
jgi:hypothetical protein